MDWTDSNYDSGLERERKRQSETCASYPTPSVGRRNPRSRRHRYPELYQEGPDGMGTTHIYDWSVYERAVSNVEFDTIDEKSHAHGYMFGELVWKLSGSAADAFRAWWGASGAGQEEEIKNG